MKQPEHRSNGKINLFPELAPGISLVYRHAARDKRWRHATTEHRLVLRVDLGDFRTSVNISRDNYLERYDKAVQMMVDSGVTTHKLAARYDGMVSWDEMIKRFGLAEEKIVTYKIYQPEGWVSPYLHKGADSQHLPIKRKNR